jgi:hypothetical protein
MLMNKRSRSFCSGQPLSINFNPQTALRKGTRRKIENSPRTALAPVPLLRLLRRFRPNSKANNINGLLSAILSEMLSRQHAVGQEKN